MKKTLFLFILLVLLAAVVFFVMTYALYKRIGVFGCGDECINYTAGYFLLHGKILYREIFFNRQPSVAYISAMIQWLLHPGNMYQLVLMHRLFISLFSFVFAWILVWRFGWSALLFLSLYEGTKVYLYGYQFIGEALIVYPLIYLFGVFWKSWNKKSLTKLDIVFAPVMTWFICVTREPYIPVTLAIFFLLVWKQRKTKYKSILIGIFIVLSALFLVFLPREEYIAQVIFANVGAAKEGSFFRGLFYPFLIFIQGPWSYFRFVEIGVSIFFFFSIFRWVQKTRKILLIVITFLLLGLAGVRTVPPGTMYFQAFHMLPWYGLFCMATSMIIVAAANDRNGKTLVFSFILFIIWAFISPKSFVWERVDRAKEFESQYAKYTHYSEAVKILSLPSQTLFLDMWDDIIYWEADRDSSYRYSLYIPAAARLPLYRDERTGMFHASPPDFYYSCPGIQTNDSTLPSEAKGLYIQLLTGNIPGCLYVKKSVALSISQSQWERVGKLGMRLP